jgi:cytidylate kinase
VLRQSAEAGNCIFVGRGAPYFLRDRSDALHVFLYAPRAEKLRRLRQIGKSAREADELLDTVDRDRIEFVKHYFGADWPTRSLYHMMINTAIGDDNVISLILNAMQVLEPRPAAIS